MHQKMFFVVMCTCLCFVSGETVLGFRARKNIKLSEDHVDKTVAIDSLMMCAALCKSEPPFLCQTASWSDGICLMSKTITTHELAQMSAVSATEGWITICRIVYPVFLAESSEGRYRLTFQEAETRCLQSASKIASRNDLLDARSLGFEYCACGWLSDGSHGFVLQEENTACFDWWHDGILECYQELSDVYCKSVLIE